MCVVETHLVFAMAALYFAVVAGRVGTDQLVPDSKPCSGQFKACGQVSSAVGETVGKLKSVVCLDTLYPHTAALEPGCHLWVVWCRNLTIPYEGSVLLLFYSLFLALLSNMYSSSTRKPNCLLSVS